MSDETKRIHPTMRLCPTCRGTGINPVLPTNVCPKCNGERAVDFIKRAYGLEPGGTPRFDLDDPVQTELRHIAGWIASAQHDALNERQAPSEEGRDA